jgi:hypothetical protein
VRQQRVVTSLCIAALPLRELPTFKILVEFPSDGSGSVLEDAAVAVVVWLIAKLGVNGHANISDQVLVTSPMTVQSWAPGMERGIQRFGHGGSSELLLLQASVPHEGTQN